MRSKWTVLGLLLGVFTVVQATLLATATKAAPPLPEVVNVWKTTLATGTNLLSRDLNPKTGPGLSGAMNTYSATLRFMIGIAPSTTASVVDLYITRVSDSTTQAFAINGGTALTPGQVYAFTFPADAAFNYNFRVETATTIGIFTADRHQGD